MFNYKYFTFNVLKQSDFKLRNKYVKSFATAMVKYSMNKIAAHNCHELQKLFLCSCYLNLYLNS